jgi:hypothetical protein
LQEAFTIPAAFESVSSKAACELVSVLQPTPLQECLDPEDPRQTQLSFPEDESEFDLSLSNDVKQFE